MLDDFVALGSLRKKRKSATSKSGKRPRPKKVIKNEEGELQPELENFENEDPVDVLSNGPDPEWDPESRIKRENEDGECEDFDGVEKKAKKSKSDKTKLAPTGKKIRNIFGN